MIDTYLNTLRSNGFSSKDILLDPRDTAAFCQDWRGLVSTNTPAVLLPKTTKQVQVALKTANDMGVKITPQGGRTGLALGSIPLNEKEIVLCLKRMNRILHVDKVNATLSVEAGCILEVAKQAAQDRGFLLPLSLAAKGSCVIGGNLSTNAGGTNVLRYGNAREQCLGLEAVLSDGTLVRQMSGLRKDNRGMDLKQLFIGTEGIFGVITAAVLKLYPLPKDYVTFALGFDSPHEAMALLSALKGEIGDQVTSFEVISKAALDAVRQHSQVAQVPFTPCPHFTVIGEVSLFSALEETRDEIYTVLASHGGACSIVAQSEGDRSGLWDLREEVVHAQKAAGASIKYDVSVPLNAIPELFIRGMALAPTVVPGCIPAPFGHAGDGNLHFNITSPLGMSEEDFFAKMPLMNAAIHGLVQDLGGSFSAEHGIGSQKASDLPKYLDAGNLSVLKMLKNTFDPKGTLNAGKVLLS